MAPDKADQISCMIAGVHKCGTTTLRDQLAEHPAFATHAEMEMTFFSSLKSEFEDSGDSMLARYFPDVPPGTSLLAKHAAACCDEEELARLAAHSPDCRVILSIRDPVERAHSAYLMESARGSRQLPFAELVGEMLEGEPGDEDWRERIYLRLSLIHISEPTRPY